MSRREMVTGAAPTLAGTASRGRVAAATGSEPSARRPLPASFLWGTAISAHQSEGNNIHSDAWLLENLPSTVFKDPSGDACDSYNRYEEDISLAAELGFNCYRMGIEWARIEPEPGRFSQAELDHYVRVLETCRKHGLAPILTYSHFTVPLWFAQRGGFEVADGADLFARFAGRATDALGDLIGMASTFNEANIPLLLKLLRAGRSKADADAVKSMIAAAAQATSSPEFSSLLFADPDRTQPVLLDAHAKAQAAIKASTGDFPVGVTLSMQSVEAVGPNSLAPIVEDAMYGGWIEAAKASDFVGVQTYTRIRVGDHGALPAPEGAEMTAAGYEYYPPALGDTIRLAARLIGKPIYVTESGIATDDDARRIAFIDATIEEVRRCIDEGIPVHSYMYWSLLDNFEWTKGYGERFGLVSVDPKTFARTPKPSAVHLGERARAHGL